MDDISHMSDEIKHLQSKLNDKSTLLKEAFTETVTQNDEHVRLYTGLPSLAMFLGIFNSLTTNYSSVNYWSGQPSARDTNYRRNRRGKPGPARKLSLFQEFILTLVYVWVPLSFLLLI